MIKVITIQYRLIERKLKKKKYSERQRIELLRKFYSLMMISKNREAKEIRQKTTENFLLLCEKSGAKQWEVRDALERDFNIRM